MQAPTNKRIADVVQVAVARLMFAICWLKLSMQEKKFDFCVACSGIASLLLSGGWTAHSWFKIPIPINKASTYNIKKDDHMNCSFMHLLFEMKFLCSTDMS